MQCGANDVFMINCYGAVTDELGIVAKIIIKNLPIMITCINAQKISWRLEKVLHYEIVITIIV